MEPTPRLQIDIHAKYKEAIDLVRPPRHCARYRRLPSPRLCFESMTQNCVILSTESDQFGVLLLECQLLLGVNPLSALHAPLSSPLCIPYLLC